LCNYIKGVLFMLNQLTSFSVCSLCVKADGHKLHLNKQIAPMALQSS
jgi:hypothetical protein